MLRYGIPRKVRREAYRRSYEEGIALAVKDWREMTLGDTEGELLAARHKLLSELDEIKATGRLRGYQAESRRIRLALELLESEETTT